MPLSKILSLFAWFNAFALMWITMFAPLPESRGSIMWGLLLFIAVAIISTIVHGQGSHK